MAYVSGNPATRKQLQEWIADGRKLTVYNPSGMFPVPDNGTVSVEGPHYPKPHRWYGTVTVEDGYITKLHK